MKKKQFVLLASIFGILLLYVLVTRTGDKGFNTVNIPMVEAVTVEDMSVIELKNVSQVIRFEKKEKGWKIITPFEFTADESKINSLVRTLADIRITDMISENPESEAEFGLNSLTARTVVITGKENKKLKLFLGKVNNTGSHTFAKLPDDNKIYQVLGNYEQHLQSQAKDWRSLKVLSFEKDQVKRFSIVRKNKKALKISKNEVIEEKIVNDTPANVTPTALPSKVVWQAKNVETPLSDYKVNQFLDTLAKFKANSIVDESRWKGNPLAVIEIETSTESFSLEVLTFNKASKHYLVKGHGSTVIYEIPEYQGKNILKKLSDFQN